jgi:tetratricopeptide (TPR) repeat protein
LDIVERDEDRRTLDSARLLGLKAAALEGSGNFSEAVRFYRRASRAAPENDDLFGSFIKTLTKTGRSEEALSEIEQRLLLMPTNGRALLDKGRLRVEAERYEEAIETLQKAEAHIAVDGRWDVCMHLATALLSLHRFREALDALERAAQVDNELVDAHTRMALILIEIAEYDRANQVLGAAIVRIPAETSDENKKERLALLWYVRGWALRCAGSACASELREVFERAVKLTPNEPYAKRLLAWALLHEDDGREKGEGILLALVDERSGVKSGDLAAWCHYMLGQYEAAEHWLRGMVNSDPNDVATRFDLALSLLALKREEGVEEYKAALELARKQARDRQRGILYIAAADLIEASEDRRVKDVQAQTVWESLWTVLKELQRHTEEFATLRNRALATFRARSAA